MPFPEIKKVAVILNSTSSSRSLVAECVKKLSREFQTELFETRTADDAVTLASCAVEKKFDAIIAAGGDGTLHQVVNGVLQGREQQEQLLCIGVLPIGSGNDFARSICVSNNSDELIALLRRSSVQRIDVGRVEFITGVPSRYFINEASVGLGPEVVQNLHGRSKAFPGLSYYLATIKAFFTYKPFQIAVKTPSWEWQNAVRVLAVSNGKYFGHGLCIAPESAPDDGIFSVFACGSVTVLDFIRYTGRLKRGKRIDHPGVSYRTAAQAEIFSEGGNVIEADGEIIGTLPATISILPKRLWFLKQNASV